MAEAEKEKDRICFVISPIGDPDSDIRKRSDQVLKYVIEPACSDAGYKPVRADTISEPGIITSQVIKHVAEDPMVVADLTGKNPNVFYELALRHALRKPFVQIIQKGERIPFDVAGVRTIELDHKDLDSVAAVKTEMVAQMRSMKDGQTVDSPISVGLDIEMLRRSGNPEQRQMAELLAGIGEIKQQLSSITTSIGTPNREGSTDQSSYSSSRGSLASDFRTQLYRFLRQHPKLENIQIAELMTKGRHIYIVGVLPSGDSISTELIWPAPLSVASYTDLMAIVEEIADRLAELYRNKIGDAK